MQVSKKQVIVWCGALLLVFAILIVAMYLSQSERNIADTPTEKQDSTTEIYNITSMEGRKTYIFSPQTIKYFFTPTAEEFFRPDILGMIHAKISEHMPELMKMEI